MNEKFKILVNNLTEDIIRLYELPTPITDIDAVVQKLGGRIVDVYDNKSLSCGEIKKENNGFAIYVSSYQDKERRTFVIAHELGHLFLHMGYQTNKGLWDKLMEKTAYYRSDDPLTEFQANEFASALLMPRKEYKKIMDQNTERFTVRLIKIAEYFHVSITIAADRGKSLGYLRW